MGKNSNYASLVDVAKKAGVSPATASRVLNNSDYPVSNELKRRVMISAKELKYIPNSLGKMLKQNATKAIGIIVPTLQNPFYNQVIVGIEAAAAEYGYEIRLFSSHRSIEQERTEILELLSTRTMSLIIASNDTNGAAIDNYISCGGHVALLEANFSLDRTISIDTDLYSAGHLAADYLVDMGHRNIAFLSSPITKFNRENIYRGITDCLNKRGVPFNEKNVFFAESEEESGTGMYEFELGRNLAEKLLKSGRHFTAIIAINDMTAFGVIQTLNKNGISVPSDISIISFDNILYSQMISPPLTTVALASDNMGYSACRMLISMDHYYDDTISGIVLNYPSSLVVRDSVKQLDIS